MPYTLLLADDSVTIQRVIELTFADEDVHVVAVGDGDEAIALLDRTPPDIVLAEIGMPGKGGFEVAQHMRSTPRLAHIPILLLTGAFEPVDPERARAAGCDGVLTKPFEPQLVISRVKELLATPRPAAIPAEPPARPSAPAAARTAEVDQYFDRLDAAFASLPTREVPKAVDDGDWLDTPPGGIPVPDLPLSYTPPPPLSFAEQPAPPPLPLPPPAPVFPPVADAFAALLAAEQQVPLPPPAPAWPTPPPPEPPSAAVSEEIIAEVTRRVLGELSDRVVRETVSEIVSEVAERLVREEIERIKSSIK